MQHSRRLACAALLALGTAARAGEAVLTLKTSGQAENLIKFDPGSTTAPGLSVELMRAIERLDPGLRFSGQDVLRPVRRIDLELESGELDLFFGLVRSAKRLEKFVVLAPPLYEQFTQLAVRADDSVEIERLEDIRKLGAQGLVGVPRGSAYVEQLKQLGGVAVDDGTVAVVGTLKKLIAGRVRFVYFGGAVLQKYLHEEGLEKSIRLLPTRFNREDVCVMVSRKADAQIAPRIERALARLQASGELTALREKYGVR